MARAVYPGSFDPVTRGHLDIIRRAAAAYDQLVVSVVVNINKTGRFSVAERMELLREVTAGIGNVEVASSRELLVDYCRREQFSVVVRGLRTTGDFQVELRMAQANRALAGVETVLLMMEPDNNVSSSLVKEIVDRGGPTTLSRL